VTKEMLKHLTTGLVVLNIAVLVSLVFEAGRRYEQRTSAVQVVVKPGTVYDDQAAPLRLNDAHRPDWINGNLALGVADEGERPLVGSVGDFTVIRTNRSGAVWARCLPEGDRQ
jgi:hypothetical protein